MDDGAFGAMGGVETTAGATLRMTLDRTAGTLRLNEQTQRLERVGGVSYTVKDGIAAAARAIDSGAAMAVLEKLVAVSHGGKA